MCCHSPCVVGVLPCVVNPSPVCGGTFARVWLCIRRGAHSSHVDAFAMWLRPCVCVWLGIRLCVVVAFARVWLSIRPCVVDHSPVCGSSKTNPTSRICNIVKG